MSEIVDKYKTDSARYYKVALDSLDSLRDSIFSIFAEADVQIHLLEQQASQVTQKWHTAKEIPSEDSYYIVATDNGAVFVSRPVLGKWIRGIAYWMEIPQLPQ